MGAPLNKFGFAMSLLLSILVNDRCGFKVIFRM